MLAVFNLPLKISLENSINLFEAKSARNKFLNESESLGKDAVLLPINLVLNIII